MNWYDLVIVLMFAWLVITMLMLKGFPQVNLQSSATDFPTTSNHLDDIELDKPTYDVSTTSKMDISMIEPSSAHVSMDNPVKTISNSPTSLARMCKGIMHLCF